jgi:hypothetical protein
MRTKNAARITRNESEHLARVKSCDCSVCDAAGPSEAHHIEQGEHWTAIALCTDCHRGSVNGWHGQKVMWRIHKMNEIKALGVTLRRVNELLKEVA